MRKLGFRGRYGGALKLLILYSLREGPAHAYALMRRIEELTGRMPSSGAFFPLLNYLKHHGLVEVKECEKSGRKVKVYSLSEKGSKLLERHQEQVQEALRMARSFKRFEESGCSRIFRVISEIAENMDRLSEGQVAEVRRAIILSLIHI